MNPDHMFRTVLILWALPWFPVALFYRVRSLASREKLGRQQEGLQIFVTLPVATQKRFHRLLQP